MFYFELWNKSEIENIYELTFICILLFIDRVM